MKKIDDSKLRKMIEEGKTGKECADFFCVSPPAISKRLKRLSPPPRPESFQQLTKKEQKFCLEIANGCTATQSALKSFEVGSRDSAKSLGCTLMKKPEIELAINELMIEAGLTKRYRLGKLKQHVDSSSADVSLKALDQSWKLDGSYAPVQINYSEFGNCDLTPEERDLLRMLEAKIIEGKVISMEDKTGIKDSDNADSGR